MKNMPIINGNATHNNISIIISASSRCLSLPNETDFDMAGKTATTRL